jgi:hypothetical protein
MIRYALRCRSGHAFEAWFRDSAAYDAQRAQGVVACAVCGDAAVEKALMAPSVRHAESGAEKPQPVLSAPDDSPLAQALSALRRHVEQNADYVGPRFAEEARRIHAEGGAERPIWGEATPAEARALREDGVPVAPLPPLPHRND